MSESDVYRRQILTFKGDPRAGKVEDILSFHFIEYSRVFYRTR